MRPRYLAIIILLLCLAVPGPAVEDEAVVKSLLIEKISLFVRWPEQSGINDKSQPFIIGVIGENPLTSVIGKVYAQKKIKNKNVEIRQISRLNQIAGCHVLYISASLEKILSQILNVTKDMPVLTVGDTLGFAEQGVLVNFYVFQNRLHFEINEPAFRRTPLSVSTRLLEIAKIVAPPGAGK